MYTMTSETEVKLNISENNGSEKKYKKNTATTYFLK